MVVDYEESRVFIGRKRSFLNTQNQRLHPCYTKPPKARFTPKENGARKIEKPSSMNPINCH